MKRFLFMILAALLLVGPVVNTAQAIFVNSDIQSPTITRRVSTLADLKLITGKSAILSVELKGRISEGDGGEGIFRWLSGDQSADPDVLADNLEGKYVKPTSPGDGSTGAWVRLDDGIGDPRFFGAACSGDDSAEVQAALTVYQSVDISNCDFQFDSNISFTMDNQTLFGGGRGGLTQGVGATLTINGKTGGTLRGFQYTGTGASAGILVTGNSSHTHFHQITFFEGQQRVFLNGSTDTHVEDCLFDGTGYGVISQAGTTNNNVLVEGNTFDQILNDAVLSNSATVNERNWTITGNNYKGSGTYPTVGTEQRFVGITQCENVVITDNIIEKTAGDAAIHLEDLLGDVIISNNIFDNCLVGGGNNGYIYLLSSAKDTIISGNIFKRTDVSIGSAFAASVSSDSYTNMVTFHGNKVEGTSLNMGGVDARSQSGETTVTDNVFTSNSEAIFISSSSRVIFSGNYIKDSDFGARLDRTATSGGGDDWLFSNNLFTGTLTQCISTLENTSGTGAPNRWLIQGNVFDAEVFIRGQSGAAIGSTGDAQDIKIIGNSFRTGAILTTQNTMSRRVRAMNTFDDSPSFSILDLLDFADDAAAAVGGIDIGGTYRNGSVVQVRVI